MSGVAIRLKMAKRTPASPDTAAERTKAARRRRATLPPTKAIRSRFSREAWRRSPKGEATMRRRSSTTSTAAARASRYMLRGRARATSTKTRSSLGTPKPVSPSDPPVTSRQFQATALTIIPSPRVRMEK